MLWHIFHSRFEPHHCQVKRFSLDHLGRPPCPAPRLYLFSTFTLDLTGYLLGCSNIVPGELHSSAQLLLFPGGINPGDVPRLGS